MAQLMRTSNPALNDQVFRGEGAAFGEAMTLQGTVNKTGILLLCAVLPPRWTWNLFLHSPSPETVGPLALVGVIGGLIFAFATIFQENLGARHRADLRIARRTGSGQRLRHAGAALSGHRHSGREPDVRHAGGAAAGVSLGPDSRHATSSGWESSRQPAESRSFYVIEMVLGFFGVRFAAVNGAEPLGSDSAFSW